ncbi:uracil-DNA glycosylase [sulfur-oxidizing endosymbiont of Gigantopelta aegis]|uniref:uracil-DNA glycosylase n=1 Tax=sulfur-oxidizing endosymbiont of Gigantopelta aegis TaxID=2794934 RepID=UPI002483AE64|nr:uracil-DNA glycosylase [sulfur-oxidizing endosymbiont of Gigantopelta aegis]
MQLIDVWKKKLFPVFESETMAKLKQFLQQEKEQGKAILPHSSLWFNALNTTLPEQVKVVILGQDPYPTPGHAHGLCFSVLPGIKPPKSLVNIYKELQDDLGIVNQSGHLQSWAEQGVLLLNSVLTVESGQANAHQGKGWEFFTDAVINELNQQARPIAFVLWGAYAQKKGAMIDAQRHLVIRSPHPSPLSAYRGFFGSKPFSQINQFLKQQGQQAIDWRTEH